MQINSLSVLNTVTALGADLNVSTDGNTYITGIPEAIPTYGINNVVINTPVAAVAGVVTVTPTAAASSTYAITVSGWDTTSGSPISIPLSYPTAASGDTATTICDAWRAQLALVRNFSVTATGTATLILTGATTSANGTTPYVTLEVGGTTNSVSSASSSGGAVTLVTNISATRTTQSVVGVGLAATLVTKYPPNTQSTATNYADISNLTSGYYYTEVIVSYSKTVPSSAFTNTVDTCQAVILVKFDTGVTTASTTNYYDLLGTYGTITGLAAGDKYTITLAATTTAAVTVTTGAIALASGAVTFATLGAQSGDILVINTGTAFSTFATTSITGITGLTAAFGSYTTAVSAEAFKHVAIRSLPL